MYYVLDNMATCKHKVGLLTLRDCKKPAVLKCKLCNRPVCQKHRKKYRLGGQIHFICKECYLNEVEDEKVLQRDMDREYRRRSYYRDTGYRPYYYGHSHHRYRHDDYMYFDDHHHHHHGHDRDDDHDEEHEAPEVEMDDMDDDMDADDFQDS